MAIRRPSVTFDAVTQVRGSAKAATDSYKYDRERRAKAAESKNKGGLLDPNEVRGEYDVTRMLYTTLGMERGGTARMLTHEDLAQFRYNVKAAGSKFKGGITAQQVINFSSTEDRERANKQIHLAVPSGGTAGKIRFLTNSGPDSDVSRHHVEVFFNDFAAAAASPGDPKKLAYQLVKKSTLRFQCDCGKFTFFLRYVATVGGYVLGRPEKGYPKIRNPGLTGVACKHLLRVMKVIDSNAVVKNMLTTMIDKAQREEGVRNVVTSNKEAEQIAKQQSRRRKEITTREIRQVSALKRKIVARKAPVSSNASKAEADRRALASQLLAAGQITQAQYDIIVG